MSASPRPDAPTSASTRAPLAGWGRRPIETCTTYRPESETEVGRLVATAEESTLIARGLGRSYGDASLNEAGAVLLSDRLDRLIDFDAATGLLHCQAAVSLADLVETFLPRGFFFPVTPGTKHVTVGGAIAADVHGKNHHSSGSMAEALVSFRLMTGRGEILECSRTSRPDVFWATLGGMGLTGVILDAKLRLTAVETGYMEAEYERTPDLETLIGRMNEADAEFAYTVAWIDSLRTGSELGRSILIRANHARRDALPARLRSNPLPPVAPRRVQLPFTLPNFVMNRASIRLFNAAFHARHPTRREWTDCNAYFYVLDQIEHWNRAYGPRGAYQYQCVIPERDALEGVRRVFETLNEAGIVTFLAVLKTLGPESGGLLSFPMPGKTLAIDVPFSGPEVVDALHRLDALVLSLGGRVYLAKDACLRREDFEAMYPQLPAWKRVKAEIDPETRFSSSQARRLGLVESD